MIFLDASYLIALLHERDQNHVASIGLIDQLEADQTPLMTTEFCLVELVDFLSSKNLPEAGREIVEHLKSNDFLTVVQCSSSLFQRGLIFHAKHRDKSWGVTDCTSFIVMREERVREAATFDAHFSQAGFRVLPDNN